MSGKQGHTVGGLQGSEKRGQCHHGFPRLNKDKVNIAQGKAWMIPTVYKGGRGRGQERTDFPGEEMQ